MHELFESGKVAQIKQLSEVRRGKVARDSRIGSEKDVYKSELKIRLLEVLTVCTDFTLKPGQPRAPGFK